MTGDPDLAALRARLAGGDGPRFWRSLDAVAATIGASSSHVRSNQRCVIFFQSGCRRNAGPGTSSAYVPRTRQRSFGRSSKKMS